MDILWTKEKYQKIFSTENLIMHGSGDGVTKAKCCRLCGGDNGLKMFNDTYVLEGVEGRYDLLLYECFSVKVNPPDSLICEWCARQLKNASRFRALVFAAFTKQFSSTNFSLDGSADSTFKQEDEEAAVITYKDMIDLLNTNAGSESSNKKRVVNSINAAGKRIYVQCTVCKQKYPCIRSSAEFVCSRCKKNSGKRSICKKCNVVMPHKFLQEHMQLHIKAEKRRTSCLQNKPSAVKTQDVLKNRCIPKYRCPICPKRYMTAQHLAEHIKCMHANANRTYCEICGKDVKANETFEKHIQTHVELTSLQCPPKCIRTKQSLKTHRIARVKGRV